MGAHAGGGPGEGWDPRSPFRPPVEQFDADVGGWWGPWSPTGAEGGARGALSVMTGVGEALMGVDLSGWEGPASRAAQATLDSLRASSARTEGSVAAAALAAGQVDRAVREALLRAAGAG